MPRLSRREMQARRQLKKQKKRRWQLKPEYDWWDVTVFILLWVVFVMATPTLIIVTCLISSWQNQGGG